MEPAVRLTDAPAPAPVPVAWLQGDVLAEYLRFPELEKEAAPAPATTPRPTRVPVASLQGDVLAGYLRFLELDEEVAPRPTRVPPVAWLQGEVRDEFLRFLEESSAGGAAAVATCPELQDEEERGSAPYGSDNDDVGFDGHGDGVVVDDDDDDDYHYESFVDDDEDEEDDDDVCVMEYRSEDGGVVFIMDADEDDPVLELLRPRILDLPAFRARAAAGVLQQQQPSPAFPRQAGGWMSSESDCLVGN